MAGGGGKGGSTSTEVSIPAWLEDAAKSGLARGTQAAGIGFAPYQGADVAALTPLQEAAMFNTSQASSAFGLGPSPAPSAGMPTVQTFADGTRGYSAFPLYEQAVNALKVRDPAQYAKLTAPFDGGGQFGITSMPMGGPMSSGQPMREGPPQGSAASRNTSFDTYSTPTAAAARAAANGVTAANRPKASPVAKTAPTKPASKPAEKKTSSAPSRGGVGRR